MLLLLLLKQAQRLAGCHGSYKERRLVSCQSSVGRLPVNPLKDKSLRCKDIGARDEQE